MYIHYVGAVATISHSIAKALQQTLNSHGNWVTVIKSTATHQSDDWIPVNEIYYHPIWGLGTLLPPNLKIEYQ